MDEDVNEDVVDDESLEEVVEDDDEEFGDFLQVSDCEQEVVEFILGDKIDCVLMEILFIEFFKLKGSFFYEYF